MLERDKVAAGSILLVSDLETAPDDVPALARTIANLQRADIRLRVVPLAPSSDALSLFEGLLEKDAVATFSSQTPEQGKPEAASTGVNTPVLFLVLGALVFLLLAAHERFSGRIALPVSSDGRGRGVTRREIVERSLVGLGAVLCLPRSRSGSACSRSTLRTAAPPCRSGDVEYRISPGRPGSGVREPSFRSGSPSRSSGHEDDIEMRRAVRAVRLARLDDPTVSVSDPKVALLRNDAQARLDAIVASANDARQRSRAAELLGVVGLARLVSETQDRVALLEAPSRTCSSRSRSTRRTTRRSTTSSSRSSGRVASS